MKHILNDLTEQEKNSIREQHTGGMKVMTESFSKLINSKLGDVKPMVSEQTKDGVTYSVQALPSGKFKIFVTNATYKTPTDAFKVFGGGSNWAKEYSTKEEAQKMIDSIGTTKTIRSDKGQNIFSKNDEIEEQTVLGRLGNNVEILGGLLKNLSNTLPPVILGNMAKSAISGDAKTFNQVLDQQKARLGQDYTKLKNALTQGDQAKTLKNIGAELQPYINQMKSGMGNQPSNVKEDMDVSSDSDYYQERQREVSIPFDDLAMLGSLASRFCSEKENFPDCKQVRRLMSRHNLFM